MSKYIFAQVKDPMVFYGRVAFVQKSDNGKIFQCGHCNSEVRVIPEQYDIETVACSKSCADILFFEPARLEREALRKKEMQQKKDSIMMNENVVENVDGELRQAVSATIDQTVKVSLTCVECGGPKRGRGFTHKQGCSLAKGVSIPKVPGSVVTCPGCGGPAKGRGFTHKNDCPEIAKRMAAVAAVEASKPKCPECGGMKRGRGFSHQESCSKNKVSA